MRSRHKVVLASALLALGSIAATACGQTPNQAATTTEAEAPGAALQWSSPPTMEIDPSKSYEAVFKAEIGDIRVRLFPDQAPVTVTTSSFLPGRATTTTPRSTVSCPVSWPRVAIPLARAQAGQAIPLKMSSTRISRSTGQAYWQWPTVGQIPTEVSSSSRTPQRLTLTAFTPSSARLLKVLKSSTA